MPVKHGGHKDDLDASLRPVVESEAAAGVDNGVLRGVPHIMGADEGLAVVRFSRVAGHGRRVDARVAAHDHAEHQNGGLGAGQVAVGLGQGVQKDVHALVVHLVAA